MENFAALLEDTTTAKTIDEYLAELKAKYKVGIPYKLIITSIVFYLENNKRIRADSVAFNKWQAFLRLLQAIENSIPRSSSYNGGADDHTYWLVRIFRNFVRPYLEETAVKESAFGIAKGMEFYKAVETLHEVFHYGAGKPFADLIDEIGVKYDVKHDHVDFEKAHDADKVINYQNDGTCLIYSAELFRQTNDIKKSFEDYFECKSIRELLTENNLPLQLFTLNQRELEVLLGYIA